MKIKRKSVKPLLILTIVTALCAGAAFAYWYFNQSNTQTAKTDSNTPSQSDVEQSKNLEEDPGNKDTTPNTDKPAPTTPSEETPGKEKVTMTASTDSLNDTIYIRGGVNYPVPADGKCYAQLSGPSGQSVRKDTTLLQNPASTDCKTIAIAARELTPGAWSFTLHYTSDAYEGVSSEVAFTVN